MVGTGPEDRCPGLRARRRPSLGFRDRRAALGAGGWQVSPMPDLAQRFGNRLLAMCWLGPIFVAADPH